MGRYGMTPDDVHKHKMCFLNWLRCGSAQLLVMMKGSHPAVSTVKRWMGSKFSCDCKWHNWVESKRKIEAGDFSWLNEAEIDEVKWALLSENTFTIAGASIAEYKEDLRDDEVIAALRKTQDIIGRKLNMVEGQTEKLIKFKQQRMAESVAHIEVKDLVGTIEGFKELLKTETNKYKFLQNFENYIIKRVATILSIDMVKFDEIMKMGPSKLRDKAMQAFTKSNEAFMPQNIGDFIKLMKFFGDEKRNILGVNIPEPVRDLIEMGFLDQPEVQLEDPETKEGMIQPADDEVAQLLRAVTLKADQQIEQEKIGKILEFK